jgi:hypothetical protein
MNATRTAMGMLACAAFTLAACADAPPTAPAASANEDASLFRTTPRDPGQFGGGLDAIFMRMSHRIPGFAGLYLDDAQRLVVRQAPVTMSTGEMSRALAEWLTPLGIDAAYARDLIVRPAQYDFSELAAMRSRADQVVWGMDGIVFTDADEVANRVHVGVENEAAAAAVERALRMLGLPDDAIAVSLTEPEYPMQGLRDRVRPVAGGLQINFPGFLCTLGFNVRSPNRPNVHGFVTNSHCTAVRGQSTATPYWQPSSGVPDSFIGNEAHDVPFFSDAPCPSAANLCRWSDAAGAVYDAGVENLFGRIYRTTAIGSLTIDPVSPTFEIVEERPRTIVGDPVNKVGRTTGWSSGSVTAACVNVGVAGTAPQQVMLCQDRFNMTPGTQGGDSGSPMFQRVGDDGARLVGILWGTTTFSPMENIRFENEHPAGWITFPGQTPPPSNPPAASSR